MFLASPTIKFHKGNLFRKLRVTNTIQAIVVGIQKGLIDCPCGKVINHEVVIDGCCYERSE